MNDLLMNCAYFGFVLTLGTYMIGAWVKKKTGLAIFNPLLVSIVIIIVFLLAADVEYPVYYEGAKLISYLLTPATVCLAIPLYKQLQLLKKYMVAVIGGISSGVAASAVSILIMSKLFGLNHQMYVTLLPKSITTAIAMGVSEEAGGIVTLTVVAIMITGLLGNIAAETVFHIFKIQSPIAKGLALGTSAHAVGTAKALELGEIEGAMSSLSIAVAGLMTVVVVPVFAGFIP